MGEKGTPRLTAAEATRILRRHGFALAGQTGSHQKWRNPETGKQVIVADHRGKILPLGTMRAIMEGSGIPADEWFGWPIVAVGCPLGLFSNANACGIKRLRGFWLCFSKSCFSPTP